MAASFWGSTLNLNSAVASSSLLFPLPAELQLLATMAMFNSAHGFTIHGGHFTATHVTNHYHGHSHEPTTQQDSRARVLGMLPESNSRAIQQDKLAIRAPNTGTWLIEDELPQWFDGTDEKMWLVGDPGTGKTTLGALAVDDLEKRREAQTPEPTTMSLGYYYCDHTDKDVSVPDVLVSFLRQHIERDGDASFVTIVETALLRHQREHTKLARPELERLLRAIAQRRSTFYLLDALDEFPAALQVDLVESLSSLGARLIITSRGDKRLEKKFHKGTTFVRVYARDVDVERLLDHRIAHSLELEEVVGESHLREEIAATIKRNCDGMFLHAALQMDALVGCTTLAAVQKALDDFPDKINRFYADTYKRMQALPEELFAIAKLALVWLLTTLKPLKIQDLLCAVAIDPLAFPIFDESRVLPVGTFVSLFHGLVTVDAKTQTVRLIHSTASEFFKNLLASDPLFTARHDIVTLTCIARLDSQDFPRSTISSKDEFIRTMSETPLLQPAYNEWFAHAHRTSDPTTREHVLRFIDRCESYPAIWAGDLDHLAGVHVAAFYGFADSLQLAEQRVLSIPTPVYRLTPLMLASISGFHHAVQILLQAAVDPNLQDREGWSALMTAAKHGNADIVQLLIDAPGILVNHATAQGLTALIIASGNNNVDVVQLLVKARGVSVNLAAEGDVTALMMAAYYGHAGIVQLLVDTPGVLVNLQSADGDTALMSASRHGHASVVRILLDVPGILVNQAEPAGFTALILAAAKGHVEVVSLLLGAPEISVNHVTAEGFTALIFASQEGNTDIVRLLLGAPGILVNHANGEGATALMMATNSNHIDVVRLLIGAPGILVNVVRAQGFTVLMLAAAKGQVDIVSLLLSVPGISVNHVTADGLTALMLASEMGCIDVVRVLLGASSVLVNLASAEGATALMLAANANQADVVRLLLGAPGILVNVVSAGKGFTALMLASLKGHEEAVQALVDSPETDVNCRSAHGFSALAIAAYHGYAATVQRLLAHPEIDVHLVSSDGHTALQIASARGHQDVVQLLQSLPGAPRSRRRDRLWKMLCR